ncbi:MAG: SUMF1/EgtB/PvdO family nonheme iron enzyme [Planctomycetota bacterium]|nr:SUMF1/EgtB/PvdO family nonheme iron enzyme [Planctomycetota bacterium]MDA1139449.1 SUMF1/EgtB/PvdO family nonheme iron enzyme [Planctomycetota bacterium]
MSIKFQCSNPQCGKAMSAPDEYAGKKVRCSQCKTNMLVPEKTKEERVQRLGDYELVRKLGKGGMGTVYEAIQTKLKRRVALKVLSRRFSKDETFLARFEREAQSSAALNHSNIIQVYDIGEVRGDHFFAMEYVEGCDLMQRIETEGHIPEPEVLEIGLQIAEALCYAHKDHSIIHRDIKPHNIMLAANGQPKLADLGLAKSTTEDSSITQTGAAMGTPYYMSPEQAENAKEADHRSDIYSLGITMLHAATGRPPYDGEKAISVMLAHINKPLPTGAELGVPLSPSFDALIQKMCAKKAKDRYQDYGSLLSDMNEIKGSQEVGFAPTLVAPGLAHPAAQTVTAAGLTSVFEQLSPQPKWLKIVVGALALILILIFMLGGNEPTEEAASPTTSVPGDNSVESVGSTSVPGSRNVPQPGKSFQLPEGFEVPNQRQDGFGNPILRGNHPGTVRPRELRHKSGILFVYIPGGKFTMGSPPGEPGRDADEAQHEVNVEPFYLGKYEVTVGQFRGFAEATGFTTRGGPRFDFEALSWSGQSRWDSPGFSQTDDHPALSIGWRDAQAFITWLNDSSTSANFGLPADTEWEFACRSGTKTRFFWGEDETEAGQFSNSADQSIQAAYPNYPDNWIYPVNDGHPFTARVGTFKPNAYGLYDMIGNVFEWCENMYGAYVEGAVRTNMAGSRNIRGGGFAGDIRCRGRSAMRFAMGEDSRYSSLGFRVCWRPDK